MALYAMVCIHKTAEPPLIPLLFRAGGTLSSVKKNEQLYIHNSSILKNEIFLPSNEIYSHHYSMTDNLPPAFLTNVHILYSSSITL